MAMTNLTEMISPMVMINLMVTISPMVTINLMAMMYQMVMVSRMVICQTPVGEKPALLAKPATRQPETVNTISTIAS